MAKKTLTGPGLEPETSGLTYQRSSHLSHPALWMVAVPNSQLVFDGVGASVSNWSLSLTLLAVKNDSGVIYQKVSLFSVN